jgi:DNA polymerase-1
VNLLLDGYSLLFRAFYALPPMTTTRGEPTGALYGTAVLLLKLLREEQPTGIAVAIDAPGRTVRHDSHPTYKAGRAVAPNPLREQILRLPELVEALGAPLHRVAGWEADDVLATLARRVRPNLIVSGDTDLLQCVDPDTSVLFVGRRQKDHVRYDLPAVVARYGISPSLIPTWKALAGDASDNLPGLPGIGAKTASRLVAEHGDVEGILNDLDRIAPKVRAIVEAHSHDLVRYEILATVRHDLELEEPLVSSSVDWDALRAWFVACEFKSLLPRLDALKDAPR